MLAGQDTGGHPSPFLGLVAGSLQHPNVRKPQGAAGRGVEGRAQLRLTRQRQRDTSECLGAAVAKRQLNTTERTCVTPSPTRVSSCSWEWERACGNWLGTSRAGCRTCRVATRSCLSVNTLWEGKTYKAPEQPQNRKPPAARNWKPPAAPARERELMSGPGDAQESQQTGLACGESVHGHSQST
ncbi:unnamed protein product [Rangifer tarandus platyrhynchus]|uniref:Uncharacterized protein n=1 Tax=Rangifer tarandus platyrhynchus TaxID=3082113 RepID=A0AC59YWG8_RANTA